MPAVWEKMPMTPGVPSGASWAMMLGPPLGSCVPNTTQLPWLLVALVAQFPSGLVMPALSACTRPGSELPAYCRMTPYCELPPPDVVNSPQLVRSRRISAATSSDVVDGAPVTTADPVSVGVAAAMIPRKKLALSRVTVTFIRSHRFPSWVPDPLLNRLSLMVLESTG